MSVKTWTPTADTLVSVASLHDLVATLLMAEIAAHVTAGWTVVGSSDGSTAGLDGTNRLSALNKFVWEADAAAHSWIWLKSPATALASGHRIYRGISCSTGASNVRLINAWDSTAAPTGGDASNDPTPAANSHAFANKAVTDTVNADYKYRSVTSTIGDVAFIVNAVGAGFALYVSGWASATQQIEPSGSPDYDGIAIRAYSNSTPGALTYTTLSSTSHVTLFYKDGTLLTSGGVANPAVAGANAMTLFASGFSSVSGRAADFPVVLMSTQSGKVCWKGCLTDFGLAPTTIAQGKSDPNTGGVINSVVVGVLWIPMPGLTVDPDFS